MQGQAPALARRSANARDIRQAFVEPRAARGIGATRRKLSARVGFDKRGGRPDYKTFRIYIYTHGRRIDANDCGIFFSMATRANIEGQ